MGKASEKNESKIAGAKARAKALSAKERSNIARKAARSRWDAEIPKATHEGSFNIGSSEVSCAVLKNGKRILTQATFYRAIGRSRSPKAGTGVLSTVDGIPFFLQAEALKSYVSEELAASTTPVFFLDASGKKAVGYDAELLPAVAEVYLKLRDDCLENNKKVPRQYAHIVTTCDMVMRGLAKVGIVALVDEATGYQDVRDRKALQEILDTYLLKEFATWAKRFPDDFYKEIFRLRGWKWKGMKVNRPQCVAQYTKDLVYSRLAPGILDELEKRNPKLDSGSRKAKHHQLLTDGIGHPALAQHLYGVIGLMRSADSWRQLIAMADRAYPKREDSLQLSLFSDDDF